MPTPITPSEVATKLVTAEGRGDYYNAGAQMSRDFASLFGASFDDTDAVSQSGQGISNSLGYSTFSAFASEIGVRQNFDCVKFSLYPHNASYLPTQCRVVIRELTYDGTILASVPIPLPNVKWKQSFEVTAELGQLIANASSKELVLGVATNGYVGYSAANENPVNRLRYNTDRNATSEDITTAIVSDYPEIYAKTFVCGSRNPYTNGIRGTSLSASSTFSGWGNVLSAIPSGPFNVAQIWLNAFDADYLPSRLRVRFRADSYTGTILGTATAYVSFATTETKLITLYFDSDIDLSGQTAVWFEYLTNGRVSMTPSTTLSVASERYAANGGIDSILSTAVASQVGSQPWLRVIQQDLTAGVTFDAGQLTKAINQQSASVPATTSVDITVPAKIHTVEGIEYNVYWDGIINGWLKPDQLDIEFYSTRGKQYDDFWRIVPDSSGYGPATTTDLDSAGFATTINASRNGSIVATAATTIYCHPTTKGDGATRKCLLIGDSTLAGAEVPTRVNAQIAASSSTYALTFIGTKGSAPNKHEGISGKTYGYFATDAASPFVFSGAFNFSTYMSTNSLSLASGDSVFMLLGINDMFAAKTDDAAYTAITAMKTYIATMIASMKAYQAGLKIWLGLVIPPCHDQAGFGAAYPGYQQNRVRYNRNVGLWRRELLNSYGASEASNIFIAGINCNLDTKNNMQVVTEALNGTNATTHSSQVNSVHPATSGYQQIGDVIYACLKSLET